MGKKTELDEYGITLERFEIGTAALMDIDGNLFFLRTHKEMADLARAILAALGETVETKPDRSELDKIEPWRWIVVESESGQKVERWMFGANPDDIIPSAKRKTSEAFTLYESVARVAAANERKVVRL